MQVKEYVRRFYDGIIAGDEKVIEAMLNQLYEELISEAAVEKLEHDPDGIHKARILTEKFNRKGNVIADRMEAITGGPVLHQDWFKKCIKIVPVDEEPKKEKKTKKKAEKPEDNPENWD